MIGAVTDLEDVERTWWHSPFFKEISEMCVCLCMCVLIGDIDTDIYAYKANEKTILLTWSWFSQ